jgi:hypothetical protein
MAVRHHDRAGADLSRKSAQRSPIMTVGGIGVAADRRRDDRGIGNAQPRHATAPALRVDNGTRIDPHPAGAGRMVDA